MRRPDLLGARADEDRYVTTMFDYYALPSDWPGREDAIQLPWNERAAHVETLVLADITGAMDDLDPSFFIPYIQVSVFINGIINDTQEFVPGNFSCTHC